MYLPAGVCSRFQVSFTDSHLLTEMYGSSLGLDAGSFISGLEVYSVRQNCIVRRMYTKTDE